MLDVVFNEDQSRRRIGNSAANFNIIAKIALALIERVPLKDQKDKEDSKRDLIRNFEKKYSIFKCVCPVQLGCKHRNH